MLNNKSNRVDSWTPDPSRKQEHESNDSTGNLNVQIDKDNLSTTEIVDVKQLIDKWSGKFLLFPLTYGKQLNITLS